MKWKQLMHNGVAFPPLYEPKELQIIISGERVPLSRDAEELAYAWGKKRTTPYVQDPVFQTNFLSDFSQLLPSEFANVKYSDIEFSLIYEYQQKEEVLRANKDLNKKLAAQRKELRLQLKEKYGYAIIDGTKTEFASYMVEPPSIFMGRGSHPMRGRWKPRVFPEDVVLNLSEDAPVPAPPIPGNWKSVAHDHESIWLAYWVDKLSQVRKYVWPSDVSDLRQERDKMKYENAKKLRRKLTDVRLFIENNLNTLDIKARKLATVCYLIDNLSMRVGDEKEEDEADTVGASTLRVEHLKFLPKGVGFDFLGKDSVRWEKTLDLGRHNGFKSDDPAFVKLFHARVANLEAAIRCNHKRTPSKTWQNSLDKKQQRLAELQTRQPKTAKQKERLEERRKKLELDVKLQERTRDYNLNTSLRNYIDPRVYKSWANKAEFDWTSIYPKTLQRKFLWATKSKA